MIEKLEDELARMTAKKEQSEAETVIALAKQRRWSIEKERFERKMNEALLRYLRLCVVHGPYWKHGSICVFLFSFITQSGAFIRAS